MMLIVYYYIKAAVVYLCPLPSGGGSETSNLIFLMILQKDIYTITVGI